MYRPSQGHGQPKPQPQQAGVAGPRTRRGEDPLAELARLIGQEDPFKEFDAVQPRRAPVNGNGASRAPVVPSERRPDRYANGNGAAHAAPTQQPRSHSQTTPEVPRSPNRFAQPAPAAARAPVARNSDDRHPAARPLRPAVADLPRAGSDSYARSQELQSRQAARPLGRDANVQAARGRDPYAETEFRSARAPAAPETRARRPEPQPAGRYAPEEAPRHARSRPAQDHYQRYEDDYDPDYDDDAYLPEHADDIYDDVERPRRGWGFWLVGAIVIASVIAVAFLGLFAYRTIFNAPPRAAIVTKSDAPVKVEPKNTPQTAVPQSNKPIQDRVGGMDQQKTQIMRREEAPTDLTRPAMQPQPQAPAFQPQPQQPAQTPQAQRPPQFAPQQQAPQNADQPKRVKSVPLRSDGPVQPAAPQPQSNAPMPLGPTAQADEPETQSVPQRPTAPTRTTVASLGPTAPVQTNGNYVVQVASHKTPEEAQNAWSNLRQQYGQIFSGRNADIRKVDLGDRGTFYRAMVGPMNREQANALCQNLKTQGAGCIVQTR